jgi:hypothetical protein
LPGIHCAKNLSWPQKQPPPHICPSLALPCHFSSVIMHISKKSDGAI